MNLYEYVMSNPVLLLDPYGMGFWSNAGVLIRNMAAGAASGAVTGAGTGAVSGAIVGSGAAGVGALPGAGAGAIAGGIGGGIAGGIGAGINTIVAWGQGNDPSVRNAAVAGALSGIAGGAGAGAVAVGATTGQAVVSGAVGGGIAGGTAAGIASDGDPPTTAVGVIVGAGLGAAGSLATEAGNAPLAGVLAADSEAVGAAIGATADPGKSKQPKSECPNP